MENKQKQMFAYIRVSTTKQGDGVSLQEQRREIETYAKKNNLTITQYYEEQRSAATHNRPTFSTMLRALRKKQAHGVIMHKIDRGTRNLRDWVDLLDIFDDGIEIHCAHEQINLNERGSRLAADIQAVIATDYIRNLREESIKGLYGRIHQGIYPFQAPIGYRDTGSGNPKEPDPILAPFIVQLFDAYSTGAHTYRTLSTFANDIGMRTRSGRPLSVNQIATILTNPFYIGMMRVKGTCYDGIHTPLISQYIFEKVQQIIKQRVARKKHRHHFLFRRMVQCKSCRETLIGERQKRWVYYRCHNATCPFTSIRGDRLEQLLCAHLATIQIASSDVDIVKALYRHEQQRLAKMQQRITSYQLRLDRVDTRLQKLNTLLIDGDITRPIYDQQHATLHQEKKMMNKTLRSLTSEQSQQVNIIERMITWVQYPEKAYAVATYPERYIIIRSLFHQFTLTDTGLHTSKKLHLLS